MLCLCFKEDMKKLTAKIVYVSNDIILNGRFENLQILLTVIVELYVVTKGCISLNGHYL